MLFILYSSATLSKKVWSFTTHFPSHQLSLFHGSVEFIHKSVEFFYSTLGVHHNCTLFE